MKTFTISIITASFTWILAMVTPVSEQQKAVEEIMTKDYSADIEYVEARSQAQSTAVATLDFDSL